MQSAGHNRYRLDQWHHPTSDVSPLTLDSIYQELYVLDIFEQSISQNQETKDQHLEERRNALRVRAMELSQATIRPLTVLDLPVDILCSILDCFQDPRIEDRGQIKMRYWGDKTDRTYAETGRKIIQNARLVCRAFCDLASPLLCPVVRVDIEQKSLDKLEEISRCPRVAQGVRCIVVRLQYRAQELAASLATFKDYRQSQLYEMFRDCNYHAETWSLGGLESDEETDCKYPLRVYRDAMDNYYEILRSWQAALDPDTVTQVDEARMLEYQEILRRGYEEYRQKHEEQLRLIETGFFVRAVASCVSRMPNAIGLRLSNRADTRSYSFDGTVVLRDKSLLPAIMDAALGWEKIEDLHDAKLVPARILSELPIALHKAGSMLRDFYVGPFPCRGSYSMILPDHLDPLDPGSWSDLRAACMSLRSVCFGDQLNCRFIRHDHLPPSEKVYIDQYLGTLLCGSELEYLWMSMSSFGLNDGRTDTEGWYNIGPALGAIKWPKMRDISILDVSLSQRDLESFCDGLGFSMQHIYLARIHLLDGSWTGFLDMLDEKSRHTPPQSVEFNGILNWLTGGEFGQKNGNKKKSFSLFSDSLDNLSREEPHTAQGRVLTWQHPSLFDGSVW